MQDIKHSILMVDDEVDLLEILSVAFRDSGIRVLTASNAVDALKILKANDCQAVLTDFNMPLMNGIDFIISMREACIELPVVVWTGQGDPTIAMNALRLGAMDYLAKPASLDRVINVMKQAIEIGIKRNLLEIEYRALLAVLPPEHAAKVEEINRKKREIDILQLAVHK